MAEYTAQGLQQIGSKWLDRIAAAEKREDRWIKDAEVAEKAYLCDTSSNDMPEFNILHSNVETIVPSIYNSTPVPDIRPRHNNKDGAAKLAGEVLERAIATQIDDNRLDAEIERSAQDAFMAGRGVVRIRFDADETAGGVENERLVVEAVPWSPTAKVRPGAGPMCRGWRFATSSARKRLSGSRMTRLPRRSRKQPWTATMTALSGKSGASRRAASISWTAIARRCWQSRTIR